MFGLYTSGMVGGSGQLLERGGELARIEQAVADLRRGHGGVLVIQGTAGIDKSTRPQLNISSRDQLATAMAAHALTART